MARNSEGGSVAALDGRDAFLDDVERRTFAYFRDFADPVTGLVADRAPGKSFASVAAVGFGLAAFGIGVERGWMTRAEAAARVLRTLEFLWAAPQGPQPDATGFHGLYYHFLDPRTGKRHGTCELSTIDSALLFAGLLFVREYFGGEAPAESRIRSLAEALYMRADWAWASPRAPRIALAWDPETGWDSCDWQGYNEAMILHLLALASPTHPANPDAWQAWTGTYEWASLYGQEHVAFGPLFGHQFSHAWVDFGGIRDAYMRERGLDYAENSRRATYAQHAYACANPLDWRGYGAEGWGLSAGDGPACGMFAVGACRRSFSTYRARGISDRMIEDDGTLSPGAVAGSIPFAPEIAIPTLQAMKARYGKDVFGAYGFVDTFNPSFTHAGRAEMGQVIRGKGWFDTQYLGIDQGAALLMIENYRSGLVWNVMRQSQFIRRGLERAGFTGGWLVPNANQG